MNRCICARTPAVRLRTSTCHALAFHVKSEARNDVRDETILQSHLSSGKLKERVPMSRPRD
jgi:hypothetical protein